MSARSFGSLFMVASCAGAALGCYLVSLRVASERAALEDVETRIVLAQRDMRMIQTEIGTRGRLSQLERWNAGSFSLSAPAANQFLEGSFQLAQMVQPQHQVDFQAPVVLAAAPAPEKPARSEASTDETGAPRATPERDVAPGEPQDRDARGPGKHGHHHGPDGRDEVRRQAGYGGEAGSTFSPRINRASRPPIPAGQGRRGRKTPKKTVDKPALGAAKPMTKHVELAKNDPLLPVAAKHSGKPKDSPPAR